MNIKKLTNNLMKNSCFSLENFKLSTFEKDIKNKLLVNQTYTILVKISFSYGNEYRMIGRQIGFKTDKTIDKKLIHNLYNTISDRLYVYMETYNFLGHIDGIEILYYMTSIIQELKIKNISKIKIHNQITKKKEINFEFSNKILPLSADEKYYGTLLTDVKKS